jgi:hypothetical protein
MFRLEHDLIALFPERALLKSEGNPLLKGGNRLINAPAKAASVAGGKIENPRSVGLGEVVDCYDIPDGAMIEGLFLEESHDRAAFARSRQGPRRRRCTLSPGSQRASLRASTARGWPMTRPGARGVGGVSIGPISSGDMENRATSGSRRKRLVDCIARSISPPMKRRQPAASALRLFN